jgi:hypothetical protein
MKTTESNEQRQEEELLAVQSIYPEVIDLRDLKPNKRPSYALHEPSFAQALTTTTATKQTVSNVTGISSPNTARTRRKDVGKGVWRPIEICMTIASDSNEPEDDRKVDLYVRCGVHYPFQKPDCVRLHNSAGLSNAAMSEVEKDLTVIVDDCARKGEEALFMIIGRVKQFLLEYDRPDIPSFYDQMLCNRQKQQEQMQKEEEERISLQKEKQVEMNKVIYLINDHIFDAISFENFVGLFNFCRVDRFFWKRSMKSKSCWKMNAEDVEVRRLKMKTQKLLLR